MRFFSPFNFGAFTPPAGPPNDAPASPKPTNPNPQAPNPLSDMESRLAALQTEIAQLSKKK
jgi:hypothetical protein